MIEVKGLTKRFGPFTALDKVDLKINKGAVCGLVGPNGAGKTTLIRHLAGLYRQDEGEVTIGGEPPYDNADVKGRCIFIQDDVAAYLHWNMETMHAFYRDMYPAFDEDLYRELDKFLPPIDPKKRIAKLSRGMKKQVAFRLAIASKPEVLLLDEPVDGLDPVVRHQMWSVLMRRVSGGSLTVLVSSHNLRELEDVCDSIVIMDRGRIKLASDCDELKNGITKLQVAFSDGMIREPTGLDVLHCRADGNIREYVVRGDSEEIKAEFERLSPAFMQQTAVSLEEVFIYALGGENDEIKEIL